jgi:hypothetical protein
MAITEEKEELIRSIGFPTPPKSDDFELPTGGSIHEKVDEALLHKALHDESARKVAGPDRITLSAVRLIWSWEKQRIIDISRQCIRIGYHPEVWKNAKGIVIRKANKPDYKNPKAY